MVRIYSTYQKTLVIGEINFVYIRGEVRGLRLL